MNDEASKEDILINVTPSEVRAALLENGVSPGGVRRTRGSARPDQQYLQGTGFSRVLPGMQAAFVDIGAGERTAFLHASDIARGRSHP